MVNSELVGLAFAAGMVSALNPCGFAMLPAYLTLVVQREQGGQLSAMGRAVSATAVMALGFLTVFASFGLLTVSVASLIQQYLPYATLFIGIALVALGVWLMFGKSLAVWSLGRAGRWAPTGRLGSMFGYGVGYAIASLSCTIGPFLAVTGSSLRAGSGLGGLVVYVAYAAGFAIVVGVLSVAVAAASSLSVERMRRALPYVNRVSGAVLATVGLYVAYYGWFELRLFNSTGSVDDPVIRAAGRVQRALASWVYQAGAWPWLVSLGLVMGGVAAVRTRRRFARPQAAADKNA